MLGIRALNSINARPAKPIRRWLALTLPAAIITLVLFSGMQRLIAVDDFEPSALTVYDIQPILISDVEDERLPEKKIKPVRPDEMKAPPTAPPIVKTISKTSLPTGNYFGGVPADYGLAEPIRLVPQNISSVIDRTTRPISPPIPVYPERAISAGVEGACEVRFSLTPRGEPFDVIAKCTNSVFESAAEKAVKRARFSPKVHQGRAVTVTGVIYPIEFKLEQ